MFRHTVSRSPSGESLIFHKVWEPSNVAEDVDTLPQEMTISLKVWVFFHRLSGLFIQIPVGLVLQMGSSLMIIISSVDEGQCFIAVVSWKD